VERLPQLGAIGIFERYALENVLTQKTSIQLTSPIDLEIMRVEIGQRELFSKRGEKTLGDSIHFRFEIADQKQLLDQINGDKRLIRYLKSGEDLSIITMIELKLSETQAEIIDKTNWYDLLVDESNREIIRLKNSTEVVEIIYLDEAEIIDFKTLDFCWGSVGASRIAILDLVPNSQSCNKGSYKSAKKAENKYNFGF